MLYDKKIVILILMATTKRVKSKAKRAPRIGNWSLGAVIVALLGTFLILVSLLSKPQFTILHHTVVLTQGVIAPAIIMSTIVWAIVEAFTPPGKGIMDLLARIVPAILIGAFIGGTLGYLLNFGGYVINPAFNGNYSALFFLISALVAGLAITWEAAWIHNHGLRGQKGSGLHSIRKFNESGTSKARRLMLSLLLIFVALLVIVPVGADMGNGLVSGHDNSHILQSQSIVTYVYGQKTSVPFAQTNGTATFSFPSTSTTNSTNVTTVTYQHVVFVKLNLTLQELNNFAASKMVLTTNYKGNSSVELGTGNNSTTFQAFTDNNFINSTSMEVNLTTPLMTSNQSQSVMIRMYANVTSISMKASVYGSNGLLTSVGPYQVVQFSYLIGGVILLFAGFFSLSMYDVDLSFIKPARARKLGGGRR